MKCFIIIGMPAAGKDIARQFARSKGYPYFATGDIVRAEAARREFRPMPKAWPNFRRSFAAVTGRG